MNRITLRIVDALLVLLLAAGAGSSLKAQWNVGDVFIGAGHGSYLHCTNTGTDASPSYTCDTFAVSGFGTGDPTAGCAWDSQLNFYATDPKSGLVAELNGVTHSVFQTLSTGLSSTSVMFDSSGNLYVGNASVAGTTNAGVLKYVPSLPPDTSTGNFTYPASPTATFNTGVNSDWIDLANDQKTLYFTGEGFVVEKEDLSTLATTTFSTSPLNTAFAVRLLPPFDGTGGLLLADTSQVVRLDSTGKTVQVYTFPGSDALQALTLDPNGTSAWVGDSQNQNVFRFDISTGTVEATISASSTLGGAKVNGVCVRGGPELNVVPLVYNTGTNVGATAGFGAAKTANFHSWGATVDTVNTKFVLIVTATEGIDLGRFDEYFCNQAEPGTGAFHCPIPANFSASLKPLPYADQVNFAGTAVAGKPVVYRAANPPPAASFSGNIFIYVTYTVPPLAFYTPPACPVGNTTASVSDPRLFRDPSSPPPVDAALNHSFAFDSTTFTKLGDSGTGGIIPKFNDFNVADRCPSTAGSSATFLPPLSNTTTTNVTLGKSVSIALSVVDASGNPITDGVTPPNNITLSITQFGVPLTVFGVEGNSPNFFKITNPPKGDDKYHANLGTGLVPGLTTGLATLCVTSINTNFVVQNGVPIIGTATGQGEFPPACAVINLQ